MSVRIINFGEKAPSVVSWASVGGSREKEGPLGDTFDHIDMSGKFSMDTWEQSEGESQRLALNFALSKVKLAPNDIDALYAGDLINQCTGSAYGLLSFDIPYFGVYGACSTSAETITLASINIASGHAEKCAAVSSSHFCSAERQFRFPLEYGSQRTPTSQWTVTAACAFILSKEGSGPYVTSVMPGKSFDGGINDPNNMGAAMAPAVVTLLCEYFKLSGKKPQDFDRIYTGDLGYEGWSIVKDLMLEKGYDMGDGYKDCGLLIYDRKKQDMHAGGSGCGCSASVLAGEILPKLKKKIFKDVLYIPTGALLSPASVLQGLSIPGIAYLVRMGSEKLLSETGDKIMSESEA